MNQAQELWWSQAQADHALFVQLRRAGVHECHLLHYLQMATEKLSKAYLWRSGHAPPKSHTGFVRFLKALLDRRNDLDRIAAILGFGRREDLDHLGSRGADVGVLSAKYRARRGWKWPESRVSLAS